MAEIVMGIGSSHGPTIQNPPERWLELGEKDFEDPRYSYAELLKSASPELEKELAPEKMQERYEAIQRAIGELSSVMVEAAADVIVCVSNPHGVPATDRMAPVFGIYMNESESTIERSGHQTSARRKRPADQTLPARRVEDYATSPQLADHLMRSLITDGFDVASCFQSHPAAGIESVFTFPYNLFLPDRTSTAVVPFLLSRYLPHQATPARCYAVGQAIRRSIEAWDSDKTVAIFASGGLSHQIIDEELDRTVITAMLDKDVETLSYLPRERLNRAPGTPEILNWVVVAGAMEREDMTLIDYIPCYRSKAGTGHGVTLAYWK